MPACPRGYLLHRWKTSPCRISFPFLGNYMAHSVKCAGVCSLSNTHFLIPAAAPLATGMNNYYVVGGLLPTFLRLAEITWRCHDDPAAMALPPDREA